LRRERFLGIKTIVVRETKLSRVGGNKYNCFIYKLTPICVNGGHRFFLDKKLLIAFWGVPPFIDVELGNERTILWKSALY